MGTKTLVYLLAMLMVLAFNLHVSSGQAITLKFRLKRVFHANVTLLGQTYQLQEVYNNIRLNDTTVVVPAKVTGDWVPRVIERATFNAYDPARDRSKSTIYYTAYFNQGILKNYDDVSPPELVAPWE